MGSSSFSPSTVKRKLLHSHHYSRHFLTMLTTFILVSLNIPIHHAFLTKPLSSFHHTHHHQHSAATKITTTETSITVPSSVLDKQANINTSNNNNNDNYNTITNNNNNLNGGNSESSVINVVRKCSPSVSSVTSYAVIPPPSSSSSSSSSSFPFSTITNFRRKRNNNSKSKSSSSSSLFRKDKDGTILNLRDGLPSPPGVGMKSNSISRNLGTGSTFCVSSQGYFITNYHVIKDALQVQERYQRLTSSSSSNFLLPNMKNVIPDSKIYIKIDNKMYKKVKVIGTKPEYDIAVLKVIVPFEDKTETEILAMDSDVENSTTTSSSENDTPLLFRPLQYGSSDNLLVGQTTIAIGNPFNLDRTVTTGVVSALDREITTQGSSPNKQGFSTTTKINGCIQTDASINPGNSGGPLLDSNGNVIGVSTAIVSTSGSSAGIGFAVPVDRFRDIVTEMIDNDINDNDIVTGRRSVGWLGVDLLKDNDGKGTLGEVLRRKIIFRRKMLMAMNKTNTDDGNDNILGDNDDAINEDIQVDSSSSFSQKIVVSGVFVTKVRNNSPAMDCGIVPLQFSSSSPPPTNSNDNGAFATSETSVTIGDRIVSFGGVKVDDRKSLMKLVGKRVEGENVDISLEDEGGRRRFVTVTLASKGGMKKSSEEVLVSS